VSLTYAMYLDAPAAEVRSAMSSMHDTVDDRDEEWMFFECGLQFSIREIPVGEWTVAEDIGIEPRSVVRFVLTKHKDLNAQQLNVLRVALYLLAAVPGDGVLLFNGEAVWLLRRQGQLILNSQLWNENRLALVSDPYELRFISSL
jgi:hypothetical protein